MIYKYVVFILQRLVNTINREDESNAELLQNVGFFDINSLFINVSYL